MVVAAVESSVAGPTAGDIGDAEYIIWYSTWYLVSHAQHVTMMNGLMKELEGCLGENHPFKLS